MTKRPETIAIPIGKLVTGAFDRGEGYFAWRSSGTADWLLTYTLDGLGRFGHAHGEIICQPGEAVLMRPGTLHDYGVEKRLQHWKFLWVHFHPRPDWLELLGWPEEAEGLMRLNLSASQHRERIATRFADVHRFAISSERRREDLSMNALEETLLWCDAENPSRHAAIDQRIRLAMDHCCRNLDGPVTLASLASVSGLSPSRLSFLFQKQVGTSPMRYLERQRLARARDLLEVTADPIQDIAAHVGFTDPFYFSLRFSRFAGASPRAYRKRVQQAITSGESSPTVRPPDSRRFVR